MIDEIKTFPVPLADAPPTGLIKKLCQVMAAVERIPKRGVNTYHDYKYVMEADLCDAVRGELASRNVMIFPSMIDSARLPLTEKQTLTNVVMNYLFVDGDTGETQTIQMHGSGSDAGDKGIYKAITGATKYMLMKTFLIATGDDPEGDAAIDVATGKEGKSVV